jgi:hypothetical protein
VPYLYFGQVTDKVGTRMYPGQVVDKVGTRMYPGQVVEVQDVGALSVYSRNVVEGAGAPVNSEPIFQIFR